MTPLVYVICSQDSKDERGRQELTRLLHPFIESGKLVLWHRSMIAPGTIAADVWRQQLARARVAVVIVSPDLLVERSDELQAMLARQSAERGRADGLAVVPIRYRPSLLSGDYFGGVVELPREGDFLVKRPDREEVWQDIARALLAVLERAASGAAPSSPPAPGAPASAAPGAGGPAPALVEPPDGPFRVLVLGASPRAFSQVEVTEQVDEIKRRLRVGTRPFDLRWSPITRIEDLPETLLEHRAKLLHFSTHGMASGHLLLVNSAGKPQKLPMLGLRLMLEAMRSSAPRGIVMSACHSLADARQLTEVVDVVVGAEGEITNETAWAFAVGFYSAVAAGQPVASAVLFGKAAAVTLLENDEAQRYQLLHRVGVDPEKLVLA